MTSISRGELICSLQIFWRHRLHAKCAIFEFVGVCVCVCRGGITDLSPSSIVQVLRSCVWYDRRIRAIQQRDWYCRNGRYFGGRSSTHIGALRGLHQVPMLSTRLRLRDGWSTNSATQHNIHFGYPFDFEVRVCRLSNDADFRCGQPPCCPIQRVATIHEFSVESIRPPPPPS